MSAAAARFSRDPLVLRCIKKSDYSVMNVICALFQALVSTYDGYLAWSSKACSSFDDCQRCAAERHDGMVHCPCTFRS